MNIRTYTEVKATLIRATHSPEELVNLAAQHCLRCPDSLNPEAPGAATDALIGFLLTAEHENPFEHVSYTFQVSGFSRSGMAQLTRHRIASYTFTSQHYQNYAEYPFIIHQDYSLQYEWIEAFEACLKSYHKLILKGIPKEEARQVLPNAMGTGFLMTINARSLVNFLRLRLCKRNCEEIRNLAWVLRSLVVGHFPMLWNRVHTMCVMDGKCNQGAMSCGHPYHKE